MSGIAIDHLYGIYPSLAHGSLALIDPLLPPFECPFDCITCPIPRMGKPGTPTPIKRDVKVENVLKSLRDAASSLSGLNGVLLWGFGDPLLIRNLELLLRDLRIHISVLGIKNIYVHTSLLPFIDMCTKNPDSEECRSHQQVIDLVDRVIVPYLWYGVDKYLFGWPREVSLSNYIDGIRRLMSSKSDKLIIEIHVFRLREEHYPDLQQLEESLIYLKKIKAKSIVLKAIDRPCSSLLVKHISPRYLDKLLEVVEKEGFKISIDGFGHPPLINWRSVAKTLYNQVLRMPLSYDEIKSLYGDLGVVALNNLYEKKLVQKIAWGDSLFYRGNFSR
jgi:wyosine [tRNA(Phe)-imidazoG37] synthetase (radical SAM superfamily)